MLLITEKPIFETVELRLKKYVTSIKAQDMTEVLILMRESYDPVGNVENQLPQSASDEEQVSFCAVTHPHPEVLHTNKLFE